MDNTLYHGSSVSTVVGGDNTRIHVSGLTSGIMSVFLSSRLYVFKMA